MATLVRPVYPVTNALIENFLVHRPNEIIEDSIDDEGYDIIVCRGGVPERNTDGNVITERILWKTTGLSDDLTQAIVLAYRTESRRV